VEFFPLFIHDRSGNGTMRESVVVLVASSKQFLAPV
jgi:hypothetical protein